MNSPELKITEVKPSQEGLIGETIEALQTAIRALSDPDAHCWPALLQLLAFTRRLETIQDLELITCDQHIVQILRVSEENEILRKEMQHLVGKLAARWVSRAVHNGQLADETAEIAQSPSGIGPFAPEIEPWLAALIERSSIK